MKAISSYIASEQDDAQLQLETAPDVLYEQVPVTADLTILGAGASGLALAWILINEESYKGEIVLVDASLEDAAEDEKLWCFWENDVLPGSVEAICTHSWNSAIIRFGAQETNHTLEKYRYRCIRSTDYRSYMIKELSKSPNVRFIEDRFMDVALPENSSKSYRIECEHSAIDSMELVHSFTPSYKLAHRPLSADATLSSQNKDDKPIRQQFIGWEIETRKELFDPEQFTFMDFEPDAGRQIVFHYNLPFSPTHALIERTCLDDRHVPPEHIEANLREYIQNKLGICEKEYRIVRRESGSIPLTQYEPVSGSSIPIGQSAGITRPSTGYTFIRSWRHARRTARFLSGRYTKQPDKLDSKRHRMLDYFFLKELKQEPAQVLRLFKGMLTYKSLDTVFDFMAGNSHLSQDLALIRRMPVLHFFKSVLDELFNINQAH